MKADLSGRKAFEIFQFLLRMVFQGCNLYRYLGSKKQDIACSKSTYHRFLGNEHYNWRRFITLLAAKVTVFFDTLTKRSRFRALVLDDSVIGRGRSKSVELLAFVFDHVTGKSVRGFNLLTLGWTDGFSFIPVAFNMLSSAKREKRFKEIDPKIDRRTNGYKARVSATMHKPDAAIAMIREALAAGVPAQNSSSSHPSLSAPCEITSLEHPSANFLSLNFFFKFFTSISIILLDGRINAHDQIKPVSSSAAKNTFSISSFGSNLHQSS